MYLLTNLKFLNENFNKLEEAKQFILDIIFQKLNDKSFKDEFFIKYNSEIVFQMNIDFSN